MVDIHELDEATVERIAAGEVVERPASVVKELVENSLDADAARVEVAVEAGGREGIRVVDDGTGMTEREVRRAVEEHTTSKIRDVDDLEAGVGTLGFRGEALHAIGAVSRLTIRTRPRGDRDVDAARGTELRVEGGEVTGVEPAGCPEGTTVEVTDLFYNVPARRKYLKQDATEFDHVNRVATGYALANPDVAVSLAHDGRETFATTGGGDLRGAVMSVYGREVAESMVAVDARAGSAPEPSGDEAATGDGESTDLPDGPLDAVTGLVSHPETNRASREYVSTYVNGRYVTATAVRDAAVEAYGSQLAPDRYPFAVLFLDAPAGDVDVNVHPRKLEVRFADEAGVRRQVRAAVETALLDAGLVRSSAPRGRSAPEQTEIAPERGDAAGDGSTPDEGSEAGSPAGGRASAGDGSAAAGSDDPWSGAAGEDGGAMNGTAETDATRGTAAAGDADGGATSEADDRDGLAAATGDGDDGVTDAGRGSVGEPTDDDAHRRPDRHGGPAVGGEQARFGEPEAAEFESLPSMRLLGQLHDTYVVAETGTGLVLVDQHAADERVNYERLREQFAGDVTTQALADPVDLSVTAREAELFEGYSDALATLGFRAERTGERTVTVRTVPSLVAEAADPALLRDVLGAFVQGDGAAAETVEAAADELLADLACYPSVTGNTSLTEGSVRELLAALDDCENPWACPHGRPVVVEFDSEEIEARFERDYPGHGGG